MPQRTLTLILSLLFFLCISSSAMAVTWTFSDTGPINDYAVTYSIFTPTGGGIDASLSFTLLGYNTLDGYNNYKDLFSFSINDDLLLEGYFDLGGGGGNFIVTQDSSVILSNHSTALYKGGSIDFDVNFSLISGINNLRFQYAVGQTASDESWGLSNVEAQADLTASNSAPVPEPSTILLLGSGLLGLGWYGRKRKKA